MVSSAYNIGIKTDDTSTISFTSNKNSKGPSMNPSGTPTTSDSVHVRTMIIKINKLSSII